MSYSHSYTINVSPFKKLPLVPVTYDTNITKFTNLAEPDQEQLLLYIKNQIIAIWREVDNVEFGHYVFEYTKRGDLHMHGIFTAPMLIEAHRWPEIHQLSNMYGNDQYNKAIDIQYCIDGGKHWRDIYMMKQQHLIDLPINKSVFTTA